MVVAVPAESLHGVARGRVHCGTGRLVGPQVAFPSASERQYQHGWLPSGQPSGLSSHCLAAAVGRHVEQAQGRVGRFVATARRGVGEEHAVAVAQVTDDVPLFCEERASTSRTEYQGWG